MITHIDAIQCVHAATITFSMVHSVCVNILDVSVLFFFFPRIFALCRFYPYAIPLHFIFNLVDSSFLSSSFFLNQHQIFGVCN